MAGYLRAKGKVTIGMEGNGKEEIHRAGRTNMKTIKVRKVDTYHLILLILVKF